MNPSQAFPEHPSLRWNATHYYIITFIITLLHYYITRCWLEILWKETASRTVTAKAGESRCQRKKRQIRKNEL